MQNKQSALFRQEALDSLSSPEQLDRAMQVVTRQAWLPLTAIGFLVATASVWSVVGRIPLTVTGQGVLIRPRHVVQVQTPSAGLLLNLNVKPGDAVKQGQVLATLDQSQLKQQLQQEQAKLVELQKQQQDTDTLQNRQVALERRNIQQQRSDLQESLRRESAAPVMRETTLASLEQKRQSLEESLRRESAAPIMREKALASLEQKRQSLEESLRREQTANLREQNRAAIAQKRQSLELRKQQVASLLQTKKERVATRRNLFDQKIISQDVLLQAEQEYFDAQAQLADIDVQLKDLTVQETNIERDYLQSLNKIDEIKTTLKEIEVQKANADRDYSQSLNKIDEIKSNLKEIEVQKVNADRDYSQSLNKIDEIKIRIKDLDTQETKLNQQALEKTNEKNNQIQEVKRKIAQLELQLSKDSTIVSQYDGKILEISAVPGQIFNAGVRIASIEAEDLREKIVSLVYFPDKDGNQIKPGMTVQVTPSVVKRERYGGIVGAVTNVSPFPVTTEDIKAIVGNEDIAKSLAKQGEVRVQVFAQLQEDPANPSGYEWSSSNGPPLTLSSGTTTTVRVKVGELAPIAYIIPIFRSWTGIY